MPPDLFGPTGLAVALAVAVAALWRDHQRSDADDRAERDGWKDLALASQRDIAKLTTAVQTVLEQPKS